MRRILIIGFLVVAFAVAIIFVLALANANSLISHYKEQLERLASNSVGAQVSFNEVKAYIWPDTRIELHKIKIGEAEGLSANKIGLHLSLLPLLQKQLSIGELSIDSPKVTISRDEQGVYIKGLPRVKKEKSSEDEGTGHKDSSGKEEVDTKKSLTSTDPGDANLLLKLKAFAANNFEFRFEDKLHNKDYWLREGVITAGLEMDADKVSIPDLTVNGKLFDKLEVGANGRGVSYDLQNKRIEFGRIILQLADSALNINGYFDSSLGEGKISFGSSKLSLEKLLPLAESVVPSFKEYETKGLVETSAQIDVSRTSLIGNALLGAEDVGATLKGYKISKLSGPIQIGLEENKKNLRTEALSFALNGAPMTLNSEITLKEKIIEVKKLALKAFAGQTLIDGTFGLSSPGAYKSNLQTSDVDLNLLLGTFSPVAANVTGTIKDLHFKSSGNLLENQKTSLQGQGAIEIINGSIKGVNILGKVLNAIGDLPFMKGSLMAHIPPNQESALRSPDTNFSS
ncbi:MAG: AsmA family protein, partial [SAR324 cluster bacterium]|nr:AsmA family protein [SAR324 cluster bacterium]